MNLVDFLTGLGLAVFGALCLAVSIAIGVENQRIAARIEAGRSHHTAPAGPPAADLTLETRP